jgi:hypothetical protein
MMEKRCIFAKNIGAAELSRNGTVRDAALDVGSGDYRSITGL